MRLAGLAAAALAAALLGGAASAQGPAADVASLAVVVDGQPRALIALLRADGTGRSTLVGAGVRHVGQPAWSPDGQALAFVRTRGAPGGSSETSKVHVVNADGTGERRLTAGRHDAQPAWSPDGRRVAFVASRRSLGASIMVVNADGSGRTRLTAGSWDRDPAWSPDGTRLAFTRGDRRGLRVWAMNADGSAPRPLARGTSPSWSPDGTRIAFASDRDGFGQTCYHDCTPNHELYVMRSDGSAETRITRDRGDDVGPSWSPDGTRIAFDSDRNYPDANRFDVYLANPDGGCVTRVTNSSPGTGGAAWRPGSGPAPAGPCGGDAPGATVPVVDVDPRRLSPGSLFLGKSFRGMLLSHVDGGFSVYDDCALARPRGCLGQVQLQNWSICRRQPLMYGGGPNIPGGPALVPRYSWRRGALLAQHLGGSHTDVHTGSSTVAVFPPRSGPVHSIVDALRPVGGQAGAPLPPPGFPVRVLRQVREAQAAHRRLGTVRRVQRALGLTRERVLQRLALGRALRGHRLGPPARC